MKLAFVCPHFSWCVFRICACVEMSSVGLWVHEYVRSPFPSVRFPRVPQHVFTVLHCCLCVRAVVFAWGHERARVCVCVCLCEIRKRWEAVQKAFSVRSVPICSHRPNCSGCEDRKRERSDCTHPLLWVISVTLKERCQNAPDYYHVNNGTWPHSLLMNVIYFSKRGLIIDQGPLSPPTGSQSQLAGGDGC